MLLSSEPAVGGGKKDNLLLSMIWVVVKNWKFEEQGKS